MRISIVTPTFNRRRLLLNAIKSVQNQNYGDYEHIVVDGGSNDQTREVVEGTPNVIFVSEKDEGVYDAFNKGISMAKGDLIGFLCSDDEYELGTFDFILNQFRTYDVEAIFGSSRVYVEDEDGRRSLSSEIILSDSKKLNLDDALRRANMCSFFARIPTLQKIKPLNIDYSLAADRDLICRILKSEINTRTYSEVFYNFLSHGESLTFGKSEDRLLRGYRELLAIHEHHFVGEESNLSKEEIEISVEYYIELKKKLKKSRKKLNKLKIFSRINELITAAK